MLTIGHIREICSASYFRRRDLFRLVSYYKDCTCAAVFYSCARTQGHLIAFDNARDNFSQSSRNSDAWSSKGYLWVEFQWSRKSYCIHSLGEPCLVSNDISEYPTMGAFTDVAYNVAMIFYYIIKAVVVPWIPIKYRSKDISGQIALVTGAGGGIGRLLALGLSNEGCKVVCWDVAKQANEETVRLIHMSKGQAFAYQVDLSKREEVYQMAQRVKREVGKVSILVNNAGVVSGKVLLDCSDEQIQRTFDVNVLAHFWTVKSFLPDMIMQDMGHIVTVASLAGLTGSDRLVDYCSSKFAAVGFDESLRTELAIDGRKGIKTTVVCPYLVNTPLFAGAKSKFLPALEPEDVAQAAINSILTDEEMCVVPRYISYLMILKRFLPVKAQIASHRALGLGEMMNNFEVTKPKYN